MNCCAGAATVSVAAGADSVAVASAGALGGASVGGASVGGSAAGDSVGGGAAVSVAGAMVGGSGVAVAPGENTLHASAARLSNTGNHRTARRFTIDLLPIPRTIPSDIQAVARLEHMHLRLRLSLDIFLPGLRILLEQVEGV